MMDKYHDTQYVMYEYFLRLSLGNGCDEYLKYQ